MNGSRGWYRTVAMVTASLAVAFAARAAHASVGLKTDSGWELSFDGFVNAFGVNESGSKAPANVTADPLLLNDNVNSFRVRTGLLPGLFGFNVTAPKIDGLDLKARVGLYPQINNQNTMNAFGSQIDLREIFFTVDGSFGQFLAGRALNLYQGRNILTDMTLFGVGVQGAVSAGGTTLGRIGYGYLYSQFGAQLRYTTPSMSGVKLAVAVVDPSQIAGSGVVAKQTRAPGFESELSYGAKLGEANVQAWVSGLQQKAWIPASATSGEVDKTALGWAAGAGVDFAGIEFLASGFGGKALGSFLLLDTDSLDAAGAERTSIGYLVQAAYKVFPSTKIGLSYGQNRMDETAAEAAARQAGGPAELQTRQSFTAGLYHDLNKNLKLVGEYTHASSDWFGGQTQGVDVVALGGFFLW